MTFMSATRGTCQRDKSAAQRHDTCLSYASKVQHTNAGVLLRVAGGAALVFANPWVHLKVLVTTDMNETERGRQSREFTVRLE